jgi:hypothetical protein
MCSVFRVPCSVFRAYRTLISVFKVNHHFDILELNTSSSIR